MQLTHHLGQQLGYDAASLPHLALLAVGHVGYHAYYVACRGGLAGVRHDQQLHDVVVDVPCGRGGGMFGVHQVS